MGACQWHIHRGTLPPAGADVQQRRPSRPHRDVCGRDNLSVSGLYAAFRSVAVAKIMHASCAWSGFVSKRDEQRIDEFLRRNKKCGFCQPDLSSFQELCDTADEQLFDKIQRNKDHLLHYLLPSPSAASQCYNLRRRSRLLTAASATPSTPYGL